MMNKIGKRVQGKESVEDIIAVFEKAGYSKEVSDYPSELITFEKMFSYKDEPIKIVVRVYGTGSGISTAHDMSITFSGQGLYKTGRPKKTCTLHYMHGKEGEVLEGFVLLSMRIELDRWEYF